MMDVLHQRVQDLRKRALIRSWQYRQRNHSRGVWYRLRRTLVDAAEAWIVDDCDAERLESLGNVAVPVGRELNPPKRMYFVTRTQLESVSSARRIPVRLGRELLEARNLVLIAHDAAPASSPTRPMRSAVSEIGNKKP